ncbi:hypothetical protein EYF80_015875 [Liparis tanakae]|uniref:Uncharacterized protein n=1 Tax=Liparis tanakae TaxID=230148 RepID=A0A4Z2I7D1_9TELE|nr:hypothetical protein EYF80_015875 [Liparis tanakae]
MKLHPFEVLCVFSHGSPSSPSVRHRPTARQKHYGTTVPLQLVGRDWKPIGRLRPQYKWATHALPTGYNWGRGQVVCHPEQPGSGKEGGNAPSLLRWPWKQRM